MATLTRYNNNNDSTILKKNQMSFFKKLVKKDKKDPGGSPSLNSSSNNLNNSTSNDDDDIEKFDKENIELGNDAPEDKKKLWSKVSGLIGKDTMSLVSLPVYFFEPLTVLQSQVEPLRFAHLIEKACELPNSLDRMCYITAFNIALFSSYVRTAKPFNPLLGETFEYIPKSGKYRVFCEQVSHHPPIGVAETTSKKFRLQQESWITTKFWGNSVDIFSMGNNHLSLLDNDDYYSWKVPASCCHNIIIGKMWVEHHGVLTINNHKTGDKAIINFAKSGWFDGSTRKITGEIFDSTGKKRFLVNGRWNECVIITKLDNHGTKVDEFTIWKAEPDPAEKENKWKLGSFIQSFNDFSPDYEAILPPSDSRLRPDRRYLQNGESKLANKEKNKIEERERLSRKERETTGKKWIPRYFKKIDDPTFGYRWLYGDEYWDEREKRIEKYRLNNSLKNLSISEEPTNGSSLAQDSEISTSNEDTITPPTTTEEPTNYTTYTTTTVYNEKQEQPDESSLNQSNTITYTTIGQSNQ